MAEKVRQGRTTAAGLQREHFDIHFQWIPSDDLPEEKQSKWNQKVLSLRDLTSLGCFKFHKHGLLAQLHRSKEGLSEDKAGSILLLNFFPLRLY